MALIINPNTTREQAQSILNQISDLYVPIGPCAVLYPFKMVSGFTYLTENGEVQLNSSTTKLTSLISIQTSNDPIVVYWEKSYKSVKETILGGSICNKNYTVGRCEPTWILNYQTLNENSQIEWNQNNYTTTMLNRNIRSFSTTWNPTDDEMRKYVYIYLDNKANSPQFLRMIAKTPKFSPQGKFLGCDMEFVNLNLMFSSSGRDILSFIKLYEPGGNCAFPLETENEETGEIKIELDPNFLNRRGADSMQLEFNVGYALNSINIMGRVASNLVVNPPKKLLLMNPHTGIPSELQIIGAPANNYYAVFGAKPVSTSIWSNWAENVSKYYNYTSKREFNGGLQIKDIEAVRSTNPSGTKEDPQPYTYNIWGTWGFKPKDNLTFQCPEAIIVDKSITFSKDKVYYSNDFLNHNSFIYYSYNALPIEYIESTRFSLGNSFGSLGKVLSGFVQLFTGGFDPGWTTTNTWIPGRDINLLVPCQTLNMGLTISNATQLNAIPYDVFSNDNNEFTSTGNKQITSSYNYELTDIFESPSQAIEGAPEGKGGKGIWDTLYLDQVSYGPGQPSFFPDGRKLKWLSDCTAKNKLDKNTKFAIDVVNYKGIGKADCRMTFYSYINNQPFNWQTIWENRHQTNAKFKGDASLWTNNFKLNFSEEENNEGVIEYPITFDLPSPISKDLRIQEAEIKYNQMEKWNTPGGNGFAGLDKFIPGKFDGMVYFQNGSKKNNRGICWTQNVDLVNKNTIDLTKYIGLGNLDNYEYISFELVFSGFSLEGSPTPEESQPISFSVPIKKDILINKNLISKEEMKNNASYRFLRAVCNTKGNDAIFPAKKWDNTLYYQITDTPSPGNEYLGSDGKHFAEKPNGINFNVIFESTTQKMTLWFDPETIWWYAENDWPTYIFTVNWTFGGSYVSRVGPNFYYRLQNFYLIPKQPENKK